MRYFQQQGYDATVALSSAAIETTASWVAILVLFACSLPFAWGSINLQVTPQASGAFARQLLVAMTLSVSLRVFGDHLWLPVLIVIITLAGIIGGVSPSPSGIGVVEAGMILGLTAAGVSEADATAAVFIQRLFNSYLPPIWGWAVLVWMRRRDYL